MQFKITGDTYPLPYHRVVASNIANAVIALAIVTYTLGVHMPFLPDTVKQLIQAKSSLIVGIGILAFMAGNAMRQTGAFEVYAGNTLLFSKLETNRVPSAMELRRLILSNTVLGADK